MPLSVVMVNLKEMLKIELIQENSICHETLETAFNLIRKYWKITEIVKFGNENELGFEYIGRKITEVLEDGNEH